jgi:hypothetical protein
MNKSDGGADLSDDGKSPPRGPCKLAGGGMRSPRSHLSRRQLGGEKNKQWSESVFDVTPCRVEPGTSDMSHRYIRHVRWYEILTINHRNRVAHNIHLHLYFITLKFYRCVLYVPSY